MCISGLLVCVVFPNPTATRFLKALVICLSSNILFSFCYLYCISAKICSSQAIKEEQPVPQGPSNLYSLCFCLNAGHCVGTVHWSPFSSLTLYCRDKVPQKFPSVLSLVSVVKFNFYPSKDCPETVTYFSPSLHFEASFCQCPSSFWGFSGTEIPFLRPPIYSKRQRSFGRKYLWCKPGLKGHCYSREDFY